MNRTALRELVADCYRLLGPTETAHLVDGIKQIGFHYATRGGMTIAVDDITIPADKPKLLKSADDKVETIDRQFQRGLITEDERYEQVVDDLEGHHPADQRQDDGRARSHGRGDDDDHVRCPR